MKYSNMNRRTFLKVTTVAGGGLLAVSYTHLTLPTILLV